MTASNAHPSYGPPYRGETDSERHARLERERVMLEEAWEDVRAGRVIADEDVDAWLDSLLMDDLPSIPATSHSK